MNFTEFGFDERLMDGIEASNYQQATPIQEKAIPHILAGKDVLAFAQTGTGKTAAFLLPIINQLLVKDSHAGSINAMVIVHPGNWPFKFHNILKAYRTSQT